MQPVIPVSKICLVFVHELCLHTKIQQGEAPKKLDGPLSNLYQTVKEHPEPIEGNVVGQFIRVYKLM